MSARESEIKRLRRARPKNVAVRVSLLAMLGLVLWSWGWGNLELDRLFSARSARNLDRFLGEVRPHPLLGKEWDWGVAWDWAGATLSGKGGEAVLATLAMSVAAICLAAVLGLFFSLAAARTLACPEPFLPGPRRPAVAKRAAWRGVVLATRFVLIFLRSIPEYVWGFLLIILLGPSGWPAILALGLHNAGILGKLDAEVIENVEPKTPRALRALGASRLQIAVNAILPASLNRFLLYFFYRWETCVREATVLGMLGVLSLGSLIRDARASNFYDEMVFYVLLGACLVMLGDFVSAVSRALLRRAA